MPGSVVNPVVLDATVLSNFASSGTVDQLVEILERPTAVPAVRDELDRGRSQGYAFLANALDHLGYDISLAGGGDGEDPANSEIRERLDAGEAESLQYAIDYDGTLATDDLAARRLASECGVPVTGSVGILILGIRRGILDAETANEWLSIWKEKRGYYAPVNRVDEIID